MEFRVSMPTQPPIASILPASAWSSLAQWLRDFAARADDLCYIPNFGNAGDALIASGTWQFFDMIGLRPRVVSAAEVTAGASAIYAGGGNLVSDYQDCAGFLDRSLSVGVKEVIVLPQTIRGHATLLRRLDKRFTLICREQKSLEWCESVSPSAKIMFAHDLALLIDVRRLQRRCAGLLPLSALVLGTGSIRRRYLHWRRYLKNVRPVGGILQVFRSDVEATASHPGDQLHDISDAYHSDYRHRVECDFVSRDLFDLIGRAEVVATNRLHIGIAGALLGKRVDLYDNSYGKNRDVYDTSLKDCQTMSFHEE